MTRADNRPDPIEEMLAALREDDPTYTDAELDAGFTDLLAGLEQLTPERTRQADDLATEAELGSDAYALGLEYLERGDLERATHWLRIAASHGVSAARQQLNDARELHRTVDSLSTEPAQPQRRRKELADLLDCSNWLAPLDRSALSAATSRLSEALEAELRLVRARQEADRILADARRAAEQITAGAQRAAHPDAGAPTPVRPQAGHHRWSGGINIKLECRPLAPVWSGLDIMVLTATSGALAAARVKRLSVRNLLPHTSISQWSPLPDETRRFHHGAVFAREQNGLQLADSRHALYNLIGREATEAYEQAVEENSPSCLHCHFTADPQLAPRLLAWAQTASPETAASVHTVLADPLACSNRSLLVPVSCRDLVTPTPTTAPERGTVAPGYR
ncbi:ATP synthase subunit B family protein [Streptomyces stelliscabiei]|uniref:hypothetical protein n=1 Tax=Streptomyces stelliscabiei TaxID=146820 RepID=UPI0029B2FA4D|nr:hypothetical protein [Streptomyces stelliscabiei]MDX2557260.1 hypothetical protein [Streptomyces stelliscabiei]MDX2616350.1 hypothetical protein [Streptomyces stelliscabiei]MDX2641051.1 hypothetical protein [Streptomyces stelliscabiei]MDX2665113.1 hypothetical protein [Streptomyces stelliscabiei]MDX2716212.1 hypothetical protein [Streptomyces stelliscabiei]